MNYIEKLESNFHTDFINMKVNREMKFLRLKSYVDMLEQMSKERGIEFVRELYPIPSRYIVAEDKDGEEHRWDIEAEHSDRYNVRHMDAITSIGKNRIVDGKCDYKINIPKGSSRNSLTYLFETGNINQLEKDLIED